MKKIAILKYLTYIFFSFSISLSAQVTIGSGIIPQKGALLDLKEREDDTLGGANSNRGLGMPRVALKKVDWLNPILPPSEHIAGTPNLLHTGLMVYNMGDINLCDSPPMYHGLYIWDGNNWEGINVKVPSSPVVMIYTDLRDGEKYPYRNFGSIAGDWMLENIRARAYDTNVGAPTAFPLPTDPNANVTNIAIPAWAYPSNTPKSPPNASQPDPLNPATFNNNKPIGLLYNWAAATGGQNTSTTDQGVTSTTPPDTDPQFPLVVQGICPRGWHVPSDKEWNDLEKELSEHPEKYTSGGIATPWEPAWNYANGWRGVSQGQNMKNICTLPGTASQTQGKSLNTSNGGFAVLLPGFANSSLGSATAYGAYAAFWTSSASRAINEAWQRYVFNFSHNDTFRDTRARSEYLFSVRCKK